jgi:hypothetical protein
MSFPVEIFFRNMDSSPLVANGLRRHAEGLGRYHPRITACRVTIEERAGRHRKGKLFNLRIAIAIPGHEIVVERAPDKRATHNHFRLAAHDAFDAARRQLQDAVRRRRFKTAEEETDAV